jgi:2-oxoglutarate ferredoxin oxidoreductase subunit delta
MRDSFMSEELKEKKIKGTVYINIERCKGCGFCIEFCPSKCLEFSKDYNSKGYHPPVLFKPEECTGCDLCGLLCPDFAIFGVRIKNKV